MHGSFCLKHLPVYQAKRRENLRLPKKGTPDRRGGEGGYSFVELRSDIFLFTFSQKEEGGVWIATLGAKKEEGQY